MKCNLCLALLSPTNPLFVLEALRPEGAVVTVCGVCLDTEFDDGWGNLDDLGGLEDIPPDEAVFLDPRTGETGPDGARAWAIITVHAARIAP